MNTFSLRLLLGSETRFDGSDCILLWIAVECLAINRLQLHETLVFVASVFVVTRMHCRSEVSLHVGLNRHQLATNRLGCCKILARPRAFCRCVQRRAEPHPQCCWFSVQHAALSWLPIRASISDRVAASVLAKKVVPDVVSDEKRMHCKPEH
jgi:hypothetical protein